MKSAMIYLLRPEISRDSIIFFRHLCFGVLENDKTEKNSADGMKLPILFSWRKRPWKQEAKIRKKLSIGGFTFRVNIFTLLPFWKMKTNYFCLGGWFDSLFFSLVHTVVNVFFFACLMITKFDGLMCTKQISNNSWFKVFFPIARVAQDVKIL